jgi:hypothetical protein
MTRSEIQSDELNERIAQKAYERFLQRGEGHGHDVEDWLAAESEIRYGQPEARVDSELMPHLLEPLRSLDKAAD